jgi:hypothetical protein
LSILFKGFSKALVCGGYEHSTDTCQVVDLESSETTCKNLQKFPAFVWAAIGGLGLKEIPIICGGAQEKEYYSNSCYSLENNSWVSSASMNTVRAYAAAAQLQDGKILVTGGLDNSFSYLNSAEMLTEEGWESNIPSLPVTIWYHCMVPVNSTTVMVIGGLQNARLSGKTFYFTIGEESWTEGPELKIKRMCHACGRVRRNSRSQGMSIIVVGGRNGSSSSISSVEVLDESSNEWETGPELPFGIEETKMVEDKNGGAVLIGGLTSSNDLLLNLYQLPNAGRDAAWTMMEQKLKTGTFFPTALLVPDSVVDCS